MQRLFHVNGRLLASLTLSVLAIVLAVAFGSPARSAAGLTVQAFQSPIETPTPPPTPSSLWPICARSPNRATTGCITALMEACAVATTWP